MFGLNYAECVQAVAEAPLKYWACLLGRLAGGVGALLGIHCAFVLTQVAKVARTSAAGHATAG